MYSTNWVYLQSNKEDKGKLRMIHEVEYPSLKGDISNLMINWKEKEDIDSMKYVFAEFERCMVAQNELMRNIGQLLMIMKTQSKNFRQKGSSKTRFFRKAQRSSVS
ncbi:MAG: hypothetical protein IPL69_20030 [Saprospiraceae bacterium]|nr:hypothetical protein [Candidatus Brachybacter algidus]